MVAHDSKIFRQVKTLDKGIHHEGTDRQSEKRKRPVSTSNTKKLNAVIIASVTRSARPISKLEYFFRIMAIISVPPLKSRY